MKTKIGKIVSAKSQNTCTVLVERFKSHPIYKKKYQASKKFLAHNENNEFKLGDNVEIAPTKPISKNKHWIVTKKI